MTNGALSLLSRDRAERRALGYVLLVLISFGATVETVHGHHTISPDRHGITVVRDDGGSYPSHTGRSHQTECSVCQFQQQLFNGLVHAPLFATTPSTQTAFVDTSVVAYSSTAITRPSGRDPPLGRG